LALCKVKLKKSTSMTSSDDVVHANNTSLQKFMKLKCVISDHEKDFIFLSEFEVLYFSLDYHLDQFMINLCVCVCVCVCFIRSNCF
jgi:hypothetical protein